MREREEVVGVVITTNIFSNKVLATKYRIKLLF